MGKKDELRKEIMALKNQNDFLRGCNDAQANIIKNMRRDKTILEGNLKVMEERDYALCFDLAYQYKDAINSHEVVHQFAKENYEHEQRLYRIMDICRQVIK